MSTVVAVDVAVGVDQRAAAIPQAAPSAAAADSRRAATLIGAAVPPPAIPSPRASGRIPSVAPGPCDLYLNTLRNSPSAAAQILRGRPAGGGLPEIIESAVVPIQAEQENPTSGPPDQTGGHKDGGEPQLFMEAIVNYPGPMSLDGVGTVSTKVARAIRQRRHSTALPDVKLLTLDAATALAAGGGVQATVWFEGVDEVEPGAIQELLTHPSPPAKRGTQPRTSAIILSRELMKSLPDTEVRAIEAHELIHFGKPQPPRHESP